MTYPNLLTRSLPVLFMALAGLGACEQPEEEPLPQLQDDPPNVSAAAMEAVVDTTAQAVWEYLVAEDYHNQWVHWPDRSPFYSGTEPHGQVLATYLNELALEGLDEMRQDAEVTEMPYGSVVVKENYAEEDRALLSVTVMYKHEGYDPEHNDWFWMKRLADGTVEAAGRAAPCAECHMQAEGWDYLVTAANQFGG